MGIPGIEFYPGVPGRRQFWGCNAATSRERIAPSLRHLPLRSLIPEILPGADLAAPDHSGQQFDPGKRAGHRLRRRPGQDDQKRPLTRHWSVDGVDGTVKITAILNCSGKNSTKHLAWPGAEACSDTGGIQNRLPAGRDRAHDRGRQNWYWKPQRRLGSGAGVVFCSSTLPLWFVSSGQPAGRRLEEHLIGVPVTSMMALKPTMYGVNRHSSARFVLNKEAWITSIPFS